MTVQETILEAVRTIMGDPAFDVRWYDRKSEWVSDDGHVEITVLNIPRFGVDERRLTPQAGDPNTFDETIFGNRSLRLQLTCNTNDQDLLDSGQELAETIAAGFSRHDVEIALAAVHLGVPQSQGVRVINAPDAHGDIRSIGVVELWFPWSRAQAGGTVGTIGTIDYSGEIDEVPDAIAGSVTEP